MGKDAIVQGIHDVAALERALNLPRGFFDSLIREGSDWEFTIKSLALFESATSHLLTLYFGNRRLDRIFTRLEMGNTETGKAAFISALDLLTVPQRKFLRALTELRNKYAHDVSMAGVSLVDLLKRMDANQRESYAKALNIRMESIVVAGRKISGAEMVLNYPRHVIWGSSLDCLSSIWAQCVFAAERNELIRNLLKNVECPREIDPISILLSFPDISEG